MKGAKLGQSAANASWPSANRSALMFQLRSHFSTNAIIDSCCNTISVKLTYFSYTFTRQMLFQVHIHVGH